MLVAMGFDAFEDAAMLCFQKSEWNGETGASFSLKNGWVFETFFGAFWSVA